MRLAALVSWLVTASLGAFMLRTWIARDGLRRERAKAGGLPPQLIFGHAAAAITGLLLWVGYVVSGARPVAWAAVGLLMVAVGLGLCTVTLWTPYPAHRPGERRPTVAPVPSRGEPPSFEVTDEMIAQLLAAPGPVPRPGRIRPNPAVLVPVAHGFAAIGTFVLAVMSALM